MRLKKGKEKGASDKKINSPCNSPFFFSPHVLFSSQSLMPKLPEMQSSCPSPFCGCLWSVFCFKAVRILIVIVTAVWDLLILPRAYVEAGTAATRPQK